ncbi:hypothetical protein, partial [Bradyrhizobium sp. RT10b]|uniref:hypothetical protein n=1 Tax=Bradyrhizobium sp. RT10b TaxID=3156331 RepID=UPI0033916108
ICSSVNLARFICPSFRRPDSNFNWRKSAGAGHHGIHMEPGFRLPSGPRADSYWSDVITHRQKSCLTPTSPSKSVLPMMSQKWMIGP